MRVLITGIFGFIGSHFAKHVLRVCPDAQVIGFGRSSDQANTQRLMTDWAAKNIPLSERYRDRFKIIHGDLTDAQSMSGLCEHIDVVVNFAAKTFVDHSLRDDLPFLHSNVIGAMNLMKDAMRYGVKRYVQIGTDEVYGQILIGAYKEDALLNPRNPYSWSKACADLYAIQLHRTYGFPVIITRTENNFGFFQHRQKVLPTFVRTALADEPLPVYGDGLHVRCWLHVEEHCRAIWHLIETSLKNEAVVARAKQSHNFGRLEELTGGALSAAAPSDFLGEVFHVAGEQELTNIQLAKLVLRTLGKPEERIRFIPDHDIRPGHDRRYALDCAKLRGTGFVIEQDLEKRLAEVITWYAENESWTR